MIVPPLVAPCYNLPRALEHRLQMVSLAGQAAQRAGPLANVRIESKNVKAYI